MSHTKPKWAPVNHNLTKTSQNEYFSIIFTQLERHTEQETSATLLNLMLDIQYNWAKQSRQNYKELSRIL